MTHELAKLLEQVEPRELREQLVDAIYNELQEAYNQGEEDMADEYNFWRPAYQED